MITKTLTPLEVDLLEMLKVSIAALRQNSGWESVSTEDIPCRNSRISTWKAASAKPNRLSHYQTD